MNDSSKGNAANHGPQANGTMTQDPIEAFKLKAGLAQMLKGGVIMDVVNSEQV